MGDCIGAGLKRDQNRPPRSRRNVLQIFGPSRRDEMKFLAFQPGWDEVAPTVAWCLFLDVECRG
jgi:hypothetical protein